MLHWSPCGQASGVKFEIAEATGIGYAGTTWGRRRPLPAHRGRGGHRQPRSPSPTAAQRHQVERQCARGGQGGEGQGAQPARVGPRLRGVPSDDQQYLSRGLGIASRLTSICNHAARPALALVGNAVAKEWIDRIPNIFAQPPQHLPNKVIGDVNRNQVATSVVRTLAFTSTCRGYTYAWDKVGVA